MEEFDETLRLQILNNLCQEDIDEMTSELSDLQEKLLKVNEECEELTRQIGYKDSESEIQAKICQLEEENKSLLKDYENSLIFDKLVSSESDKKTLNETFVVLQKKLGNLETINANMQKKLKKSEIDTKNLKKKCESAMLRYKNNDELKEKIKNLENVAEKYTLIEANLKKEIKEAEEKLEAEANRVENKMDLKVAQKMVNDVLQDLQDEKAKFSSLEKTLQDKKKYLNEIKTYGTQTSRTTNKLRSELELIQSVLKEKQDYLQRLDIEIEEFESKYEDLKKQEE
jgi:chromosome segregation ATPase